MTRLRYKPNLLAFFLATALAVGLFVCFWLWMVFDFKSFAIHTEEDALIENLTALFFFLAALFTFLAVFRYPLIRSRKIRSFFLIGWALVFLFFCGEETSWGQRIFQHETPAFFTTTNKQFPPETNFHNAKWIDQIGGTYWLLNVFVLVTGVLLPLLNQIDPYRKWFAKIHFPVIPPHCIALFMGGYFFGKFGMAHVVEAHGFVFDREYIPDIDLNSVMETREFLFALGYLLFAIHAAAIPQSVVGKPRAGEGRDLSRRMTG